MFLCFCVILITTRVTLTMEAYSWITKAIKKHLPPPKNINHVPGFKEMVEAGWIEDPYNPILMTQFLNKKPPTSLISFFWEMIEKLKRDLKINE